MEERLNQMSAVLQAMQKTLECNICLDLMNKPLTTKCGHSFCSECIHQVVKGPRSSAQCPLCMTNITRRSLGHNNKITNLVIAVRKIIASIKKDCCFEVTPSKYRPRPRPVISPEDDDSENEENDEPRRGTRKRGVTSHYNPEVHVPKPRAKSAKQRILATDNGQELSLHTDVRSDRFLKSEEGGTDQNRAVVDVISQEHSYSSPTKQEPVVRTSLIPTISRGRGGRGGVSLRGKSKMTSTSLKGKADAHMSGKPFGNGMKTGPSTYSTKKAEQQLEKNLLSVSQQDNGCIFPGEAMVSVQEDTDHLSKKLGRVEPADKVANWLTTSSEVGFRIGVTQSTDTLSTESEDNQLYQKAKDKGPSNSKLIEPKVNVMKKGNKKFIYPNEGTELSESKSATTTSSSQSVKKFFKLKVNEVVSSTLTESHLPIVKHDAKHDQSMLPQASSDDPYSFIPSQKTPKQLKTVEKRGQEVKSRARGMLKMSRGRVRGRGRGRGLIQAESSSTEPAGIFDESCVSTVDTTMLKQSTPLAKVNKMKQDIDISVIRPPDTVINFADNEPLPSVIVQTHADIEDDYGIPDSCPVNTKDEFDVLVSEAKDVCKTTTQGTQQIDGPEIDAEADLLFVTPAQGPDQPLDIITGKPKSAEDPSQQANTEAGCRTKKKRASDDSDSGNERSKRARVKKSSSSSGSDAESTQSSKKSKTKAEKAKEEVEALCSMFEEIEDHTLSTVSLVEAEKDNKKQEKEKEESMRSNISVFDKTLENTKLNRSIASTEGGKSAMPPPKAPVRNKKVKFHESLEENSAPSTSKDSLSSVATRSAGKKTIPRISHNARYASEMKLVEPSKNLAVSVSVKDTKSPGWSHVAGARKDLKTRHTSLNITGGEQRNINDSRTEGGTSVLSSKIAPSSEESEVSIDDQTQDYDVEHLCSSQSKKERVKKLKEIVSQLNKPEEESETVATHGNNVNSKETKPAIKESDSEKNKLGVQELNNKGSKSAVKEISGGEIKNLSTEVSSKNTKSADKEVRSKLIKSGTKDASDKESKSFGKKEDTYEDESTVKQIKSKENRCDTKLVLPPTACTTSIESKAAQKQGIDEKPKENSCHSSALLNPAETEPFECTEEPTRKSSVSSSSSDSTSNQVKGRLKRPTRAEQRNITSRLSRTSARQLNASSSKLSRKTFSLSVNTQDLSTLHSDYEILSSLEDTEKPNCVPDPSGQKSVTSSNKVPEALKPKKSASTSSETSSVISKPRPPHHAMSSSTASDLLDNEKNKKDISPPATSLPTEATYSNQLVSEDSKVIPFRSVGPLCSKRCDEAGKGEAVALVGSTNRDLCLHAIPCEVYQVLMKYMTLLVTQQDNHSVCCGSSNLPKLLNSKEVQTSPMSEATEEKMHVEKKLQLKSSDSTSLVKPNSESDSQVIPNSCETQEMDIAIPLPASIGVKTKARKDAAADTETVVEAENDRSNLICLREEENKDTVTVKSALSSEISLDKNCLMPQKKKFDNASSSQNSDSQSSQMSTSLLAAPDVIETKHGRLTRSTNSSGDANSQAGEGRSVEKYDRGQHASQKVKERAGVGKTMVSKNNLVEVEKENLKNDSTLPVAISRPRRKPLQSGQPVIENIMSQLTKEEKRQVAEKIELSQIQNQSSHNIQKSLSTQNRPANSKPLFMSDESSHASRKQKDVLTVGSKNLEEEQEESDSDSPLKASLESKRQTFKRIRRPSSGSSSDDSDSDSVQPRKRKAKTISSSDSIQMSGRFKEGKSKENLEQHQLDSEEMRDLERLDKNVWEFFGHPDEDLLTNKDDDDKSSHVSIDDPSQKKDIIEFENDALVPSLPSDEDIPSTEDVMRNVQMDMDLVKKMRQQGQGDPEVISLISQEIQETAPSTQKPTFSASTKSLFNKVDKNLTKAEDLLCSGNSLFGGIVTPVDEPKSNSTKTTTVGNTRTKSNKEKAEMVDESDRDTEEDTENMSHSSAYSSQSEAISTQKREEVKDEVEMLKARVRELEAVVKKKETEESAKRNEDPEDDVLPPTCPTEISDTESEELFSSLPDLTACTQPKLPVSGFEKKTTKLSMSGPPMLVCTGLNSSELSKVQDLVNKLAPPGTKLMKSWVDGITHVVVKTDADRMAQRTLKYLYGVANGCWVVMLEWILDSITLKQLQNEEEYEVLDCTGVPGPHRARTTITPLFHGCEFYLIPPFMDVTLEQLQEMLEQCGARVVDSLQKFSQNKQSLKLIVLQTDGDHETDNIWKKHKKVCVAHDWIIECIGMYARICISPYIIGSPSQSHIAASNLPYALMQETQEL